MMIRTAHKLLCLAFSVYCFAPYHVYAKDICEFTGSSKQDNECSYKRFQVIEAKLNIRYKQLLAEFDKIVREDPERLAALKPRFVSAQKAWIKFRESECQAIEVWYTNGKLQPSLYYGCMERLAIERLKAFDSFTDYQI
jgi:uncharacterized protein YecT (DUF1311 family)